MKKLPNPIDKHVGSRVRMRRVLIGMSQERLGSALGLTFQQVQKYEKGTNRIGASRLQQIAGVLNVQPAYFFEDMPADDRAGVEAGFAEEAPGSSMADFLSSAEGLLLTKAFLRIKEARVRKKVIDLVTALADDAGAASEPPGSAGGEAEASGDGPA